MPVKPARIIALVPAAGTGARYGSSLPKQYALLAGRPVIVHALARLGALQPSAIAVALAPHDRHWQSDMAPAGCSVRVLRCGGATRAATVRNALAQLAQECACDDGDFIAVHDAARACVPADALQRLRTECTADVAGGLLALPLGDTLKRASADPRACSAQTLDRHGLWLAQTPQMFRFGLLRAALARDGADTCTDEAEAMERAGFAPRLVTGSTGNIKITYADDLALAEAILACDPSPGIAAIDNVHTSPIMAHSMQGGAR